MGNLIWLLVKQFGEYVYESTREWAEKKTKQSTVTSIDHFVTVFPEISYHFEV